MEIKTLDVRECKEQNIEINNKREVAEKDKRECKQFWENLIKRDILGITSNKDIIPKLEKEAIKEPIKNKIEGSKREQEVKEELEKTYPKEKGYEIISEASLRDKNGKIVADSKTGEARRLDFVIVKNNKVVDSVEVTSKTADKTKQIAKENRIRENGGNYIKDNNGNLIEIPKTVQTRIERRD